MGREGGREREKIRETIQSSTIVIDCVEAYKK